VPKDAPRLIVTTDAEARGKHVFIKQCMSCHNTPNVVNNVSNVEALGNGERPPNHPPMAPSLARTFNVGVSERNAHGLRFTEDLGDFRVIDRYRHDVVAGALRVFGDVVGRLSRFGRLDPEHGDALGAIEQRTDAGVIVDQMASPGGFIRDG
jgi:hypothetical protein